MKDNKMNKKVSESLEGAIHNFKVQREIHNLKFFRDVHKILSNIKEFFLLHNT